MSKNRDLTGPPQPVTMEINNGECCGACPFDHVLENSTPNGDETYWCMLFPIEERREADYKLNSCLTLYPLGATITILDRVD